MSILKRAIVLLSLSLVFASMLVGLERFTDGFSVVIIDPGGTGTTQNATANKGKLCPADFV